MIQKENPLLFLSHLSKESLLPSSQDVCLSLKDKGRDVKMNWKYCIIMDAQDMNPHWVIFQQNWSNFLSITAAICSGHGF